MLKLIISVVLFLSFNAFSGVRVEGTIHTCLVIGISGRGGPTMALSCDNKVGEVFGCNYAKVNGECTGTLYDCAGRMGPKQVDEVKINSDAFYNDARGTQNWASDSIGHCK
jgi:hypothetical protein